MSIINFPNGIADQVTSLKTNQSGSYTFTPNENNYTSSNNSAVTFTHRKERSRNLQCLPTCNFPKKKVILCICCHFGVYGLEIVKNNLNFLLVPEIDGVIICYSVGAESSDLDINETTLGVLNHRVEFLHDKPNAFMDFGKYKMVYEYVKSSIGNFDKLLLLNDSIIITGCMREVVTDIINNRKETEFIGILETHQCKRHCQSWWLNFNKKCFYYWGANINLTKGCSIVQDLEVNLGNKLLNEFSYFIYFPLKTSFEHNLFFDNDALYEDYVHSHNFKFLKIKRLVNNPPRPKLGDSIIELIPLNLKHFFKVQGMEKVFEGMEKVLPISTILEHWQNNDKEFPNYRYAGDISTVNDYFSENKKLTIMEIGTKRSNPYVPTHHKHLFKNVEKYVMVDIEDGLDVDVVCDVHRLSEYFEDCSFDVIISCSGYEHFKYPQLVSHNLLKCLRKNGVIYIQTHQTFPLHGYPNDYFRFSLDALDSLFPRSMGTELLAKSYDFPVSILPIDGNKELLKNWNIFGKSFLNSCIIIRKTDDTPNNFIYEL